MEIVLWSDHWAPSQMKCSRVVTMPSTMMKTMTMNSVTMATVIPLRPCNRYRPHPNHEMSHRLNSKRLDPHRKRRQSVWVQPHHRHPKGRPPATSMLVNSPDLISAIFNFHSLPLSPQNSTASTGKLIPRLVDSSLNNSSSSQNAKNLKNCITPTPPNQPQQQQNSDNDLSPDTWNIYDVGQFLRVNDCTAHCETFSRHKVDGKRLLKLTKDEIVEMLSMKVGPALKIYDLIQQLKVKLKPSRLSIKSKGLP